MIIIHCSLTLTCIQDLIWLVFVAELLASNVVRLRVQKLFNKGSYSPPTLVIADYSYSTQTMLL